MIRIILLTILILVIARAFWRLMDGVIEVAGGTSARRRRGAPPVKLVRDPVCGTYVAPGTALALRDNDQTYHFCSEQCRSAFLRR